MKFMDCYLVSSYYPEGKSHQVMHARICPSLALFTSVIKTRRPCTVFLPKNAAKESALHQKVSSRPALPPTRLTHATILIALMPVVNLAPNAFSVAFVLIASLH
jgi:hypothetical protein